MAVAMRTVLCQYTLRYIRCQGTDALHGGQALAGHAQAPRQGAQLSQGEIHVLHPVRHSAEIGVPVQVVQLVRVQHAGEQAAVEAQRLAARAGPVGVHDGGHQLRVHARLAPQHPGDLLPQQPLGGQGFVAGHLQLL
jgi:hypothetical protein